MEPAVLVLADDPADLERVRRPVENAGVCSIATRLTDEAVTAAAGWDLAAVVMVTRQPKGDAEAAALRFGAGNRGRSVPVILVTSAERAAELEAAALPPPFADVVAEPLAPAGLVRRLQPYLTIARLSEELRVQSLEMDMLRQGRLARPPPARPEVPILRVNDRVRSAMDRLAPTLPAGVNVTVRLAPRVLATQMEPQELERVLEVLVTNARDAMPSGGELTVETELDHQRGGVARPDALLSISDTGMGMAEDVRDRLFEPFFTTKGAGPGTGLDLYAIRCVLERRGGSIRAESVPGRGSRFIVRLRSVGAPCAAPEPIGSEPGEAAVPEPGVSPLIDEGPRRRLLIVEDDDNLREMVRTMLARHGFELVLAASAEAALALTEGQLTRYDLVLTDIVLPGMSGVVMADRMRSRCPELRVLFMTAHPEILDSRRASVASHLRYLRKPFTLDELIGAVETELGLTGHAPCRLRQ